jgi:ribosome maturation factor RimP
LQAAPFYWRDEVYVNARPLGYGRFLQHIVEMTEKGHTVSDPRLEKVRAAVEEVIANSPLFLVDVAIRGRSGSQVVEIFIDSDEALDVEELARVNREVGFLLDTEEVFTDRYSLNVSSPGVDRPLGQPRQYKKNVGRTLQVSYLTENQESEKSVIGLLTASDERAIELKLPDGDSLRLPYENIKVAKVKLPW